MTTFQFNPGTYVFKSSYIWEEHQNALFSNNKPFPSLY